MYVTGQMAEQAGIGERELYAWAYLARVGRGPSAARPLRALVNEVGAIDAAAAVQRRSLPGGHTALLGHTERQHDQALVDADLTTAATVGARLVPAGSLEWPARALSALHDLDDLYGEPLALWVRGEQNLADLSAASVSMTGSRAASSYGERVGSSIASDLAAVGRTVISGGAFGIDGTVLRAAMAINGATITLLPCGVDRAYPAAHARLIDDSVRCGGLVVTECPPGATTTKHRVVARNRLTAALGNCTVMVEAGQRSGAADVIRWARALGRPVGAVPGPVTSATSVGCHHAIASGAATLVTSAADILDLTDRDTDEAVI